MTNNTTSQGERAAELQGWLESFGLERRVIGPLRRDLEYVQGQGKGIPGKSGVLAGVDPTQFAVELYRADGGLIRRVPSVGPNAIETLRLVIPAPAPQRSAPVYGDDFVLPSLDDEDDVSPPPAPAPDLVAPPGAPATASPGDTPAPVIESLTAPQRRRGRPPRDPAAVEAVAPPAPAPDAPPLRRRGRPPRAPAGANAPAAVAPAPESPPASLEAPPRRGRRRAAEAAVAVADVPPKPARRPRSSAATDDAPRVTQRAEQAELRVPQRVPAPAVSPPAPTQPPDPSFTGFLKLWRELNPQGQRAAMHYIATLLAST